MDWQARIVLAWHGWLRLGVEGAAGEVCHSEACRVRAWFLKVFWVLIMTIIWKDSTFAQTKGIDPSAALDVLESISSDDGLLTPAAVVSAAEPADSPIHNAFEWRDYVAADRYREWQARQLIKAIITVDDKTGDKAPAFVAIVKDVDDGARERGYQLTRVAMTRPNEWLSALAIFNSKLIATRKSIEELEAIARSSKDSNRLSSIAVAARSIDAAREALAS